MWICVLIGYEDKCYAEDPSQIWWQQHLSIAYNLNDDSIVKESIYDLSTKGLKIKCLYNHKLASKSIEVL